MNFRPATNSHHHIFVLNNENNANKHHSFNANMFSSSSNNFHTHLINYSTPCLLSEEFITSVIFCDDIVPRLSYDSLINLARRLADTESQEHVSSAFTFHDHFASPSIPLLVLVFNFTLSQ